MNPILSIIAFLLLPALLFAQDYVWYSGKTSPYTISTEADLIGLRQLVSSDLDNFNGKIILMGNDIALTSTWTPIGSNTYPFKGTFNGQGKTISGLAVNGGDYAGLFGYVGENGQIKNLNVVATDIKTAVGGGTITRYAGGLAAYYASTKPIENCGVKANSINAAGGNGGNGGNGGDGHSGHRNGYDGGNGGNGGSGYGGGLVGYASVTLAITSSYASGNVTSGGSDGGGGGSGGGCGNWTNCGSRVNGGSGVGGNGHGGGLVGYVSTTLAVTNSYASGNVTGSGSGRKYSGGLVGYAATALSITNSYTSGNVTGTGSNDYGGGLAGYANNTSTITNSYASGNVTNNGYNGGLVGYANAASTIATSYASGNITSGTSGGIFGRYLSGTNTFLYYNLDWVNLAAGQGSPTGILGMSSATLKKQGTYINWDFNNIWSIIEDISYPYLKTTPTKVTIPLSTSVEAEYLTGQTYTGSQIKPEPTVKLKTDGTILIKDVDYVLTYGTNKDVGTGTVTVIGYDGDYIGLQETISFDIIPKTITISNAAAQDKVYNGTTAATITGTLEGIAAGDNVTIGSGVFASKDIGTGIAVSNVSIGGTSVANYKLAQPTGLTANITKKPLTITLDPKTVTIAKSDPMTKVTEKIVYNGFAEGETSSLITGTPHVRKDGIPLTITPAEGTHTITLAGTLTIANYDYSYDNEGLKLIVTGDPVVGSSSSTETTQSSSSSEAITQSSSSSSTETVPSSSSSEATTTSSSSSNTVTTPSSSSMITTLSSSSSNTATTPSSSSAATTPSSSSSSDSSTPILLSQTATANSILATHNAITLQVQSTAKLEIYNLNGKLQKTLNLSNGIYNIPLGNLPKGIYIANAKFSNPENPLNKYNRHLVMVF